VAREAWDLGAKVLVGDVDKPCEGAFWAQPGSQPAPVTDPGEPANDELMARALAELRKSDAWKAIQKSYRESPTKGVRRWDELEGASADVYRFRARRGGKEIKLVSVRSQVVAACAEFNAEIWALYEEKGGKLVPRNTPGKESVKPIAVVDTDGDGNSELLFEPGPGSFSTEKGRVLLDGELWDTTEEVSVPYMDCPC
jgi:hypothetical protein